jgi:peptidoglycan/LPS O-acetylase OafA/YrhL
MLREGIGHRFETCADSLAMGCLLAGLRGWLREHHGYYAAVRSRLSLIVGAMVLGAVVLDDHPRAAFAVGWSFQNMGIAFFIDACLHRKEGLLVRTLMSQPLTIVGRMSYSIYLWQQIFLDRQSAALMCRFPLNVFVVGVTAVVSYYGIESTSLALRHFVEPFLFRVRSRTPMVASAEPVAIVASAPHP